jgi:hypothetical protein
LLLWHHKLGHMNFDWLQVLLKHKRHNPNVPKILEAKFSSIGHCCSWLCTANWEKGSVSLCPNYDTKEGMIQPGNCLQLDQYKSAVLVCPPREKSSLKYSGGLIAVDASSGKVFVCHQVSLASGRTIQAMHVIVQDA